ncbi:DNA/RNA nuclease SfsA [Vulcanisaeta souniana]|uniref:Sugar fermentation stimulation protein homolog n=1 Tax=Vulcanisaeta souniana JCM 11219 TaxID=1293586 RepID=A0A830DZ55_9CREN|nr:DNA/RNA nuclease SfsA [Vulcanisaeta souniana]BDR91721.1 sugar fermentation stimulation protein SfsA [Vulcanisaeta souniana JCM 11219]GGI70946.1 sugar fermentation stimulation protein SfsA [Vulcanisaeta souniana JCM 11219]
MIGYVIKKPDVEGFFVRRLNRFLGVGVINGREEFIHIHDPGRLTELLRPGVKFFAYSKSTGKTRFYLTAVELGDELVLVNSAVHNDVAAWLITNKYVLSGYEVIRKEPRFGDSRFDLLLRSPGGGYAFVEVKGVTLEENGIAKFPDAPTSRGARHMLELTRAVELGYETYVLFLVFRSRARLFMPNAVLDSRFTESLKYAINHGVRALAYKLILTRDWAIIPVGQLDIRIG